MGSELEVKIEGGSIVVQEPDKPGPRESFRSLADIDARISQLSNAIVGLTEQVAVLEAARELAAAQGVY